MSDQKGNESAQSGGKPSRAGAIRMLALNSLTAVKYAQDARWPCIVRPVNLPRMYGTIKPNQIGV